MKEEGDLCRVVSQNAVLQAELHHARLVALHLDRTTPSRASSVLHEQILKTDPRGDAFARSDDNVV